MCKEIFPASCKPPYSSSLSPASQAVFAAPDSLEFIALAPHKNTYCLQGFWKCPSQHPLLAVETSCLQSNDHAWGYFEHPGRNELKCLWASVKKTFNNWCVNEVKEISANHCHSKGIYTLLDIKISVYFPFSCILPLVSSINWSIRKKKWKLHLSENTVSFPKYQGKGHRTENENGCGRQLNTK